jgi:peptidoglycan/LPS O-acetylase OafA/YrhL
VYQAEHKVIDGINKMPPKASLYGLDVIRCLAALSIMLTHINSNAHKLGLPTSPFLTTTIGVNVFFVLSGFLITYLILKETTIDKFSLRNFYMRRVLRIWPLYYFYMIITVFCSYFLAPNLVDTSVIKYYVFLLPNVPWIMDKGLPFLHHYWSLGVEEQFYIVWPLMVIASGRRILELSIALFILFFAINICVVNVENIQHAGSIVYACQYHTLLLGCLAAILNHKYQSKIKLMSRLGALALCAWLILLAYQFKIVHFSHFNEIPVAFSTITILFWLIYQKPWQKFFNNPLLKYIGKISFGIYVYHPLVIGIMVYLVRKSMLIVNQTFFYGIISVATLVVAGLSYYFMESRFLMLKDKYY